MGVGPLLDTEKTEEEKERFKSSMSEDDPLYDTNPATGLVEASSVFSSVSSGESVALPQAPGKFFRTEVDEVGSIPRTEVDARACVSGFPG